jgi:ABC-2 type transport system permease protein
MFWIVESRGINFLRLHLQTVARWPDFVYQHYFKKFFTFVAPILLVASAPVHFLINPLKWHLLGTGVLALLVTLILIKITWRWGFERYESASS